MKIDLKQFEGALPYASELFGVYQPLLGWTSRLTTDRFLRGEDGALRELTSRAISRIRSDVQLGGPGKKPPPLQILDATRTEQVPRVAREIDSIVSREIAALLPVENKPTPQHWGTLLTKQRLNKELSDSKLKIQTALNGASLDGKVIEDVAHYILGNIDRLKPKEGRAAGGGAAGKQPAEILKFLLDREVTVSSYLRWLVVNKHEFLDALFYRPVSDPFKDIELHSRDPLSSFGSDDLRAVLSPIGLVHLFRQYFFEFDTFLGPPVGHIWLSPGSSLELVEETSRRTMTERTIETLVDTLDRTETSTSTSDELSTALREENRNNIKFAFGAKVNYDNGTTEAGANTDLSIDNARTTARETAHKQKRDQTQKVSSEIRRSFKSTFKTIAESTATSSRRYVLQNSTQDLINYELRRKMRQVGVQVQDIGTQLCWQVFVDNVGIDLGLGTLLHIAEPPDLAAIRAPTRPTALEPKVAELSIQFPYMRNPTSERDGETDVLYIEGSDQEHIGGVHNVGYNDTIIHIKRFSLPPPAPGYTLSGPIPTARSQHSGTVEAEIRQVGPAEIEVTLHQVNFKDQPFVELQLTTNWTPDPDLQKQLEDAYKKDMALYTAEKTALERLAFLKAAKERIKLASQIRSRPFEDLRDEERIVVYRQLIGSLMSVGRKYGQDEHTTSELVRAIFDVDKMLYFVAPEWWRPRSRPVTNPASIAASTLRVTDNDIVSWAGPKATSRKDNYLITEESDPAPMGSSLGWLLQLDGDTLRNAFLNSPWVKAIVPIRPGKEEAAINWLSLAEVAGAEGLDSAYDAAQEELDRIKDGLQEIGVAANNPVTVRDALLLLGHQIKTEHKEAATAKPSPFDPSVNAIPTETVYEHGFYALQGSFEVNADPTSVFSQWIEVLATDQVAAVPYDALKHL